MEFKGAIEVGCGFVRVLFWLSSCRFKGAKQNHKAQNYSDCWWSQWFNVTCKWRYRGPTLLPRRGPICVPRRPSGSRRAEPGSGCSSRPPLAPLLIGPATLDCPCDIMLRRLLAAQQGTAIASTSDNSTSLAPVAAPDSGGQIVSSRVQNGELYRSHSKKR